MKKILVLIISLSVSINLLASEKSIILAPGFTIYFEGVKTEPINKAIEILQRDLVSVLGEKSPVEIAEEKVNATNSLIIINKGSVEVNAVEELIGYERHKIYITNNNLVLHGADEMATIFAIYTFSEKFLGIKPLWYWASLEAIPKKIISISNDYEFDSGVPYVKYRAWFPNDQDMFSPWRDLSEINDEILYETLLRLKLNTIEIENSIDYRKIGAVTDRAKIIDRYGLIMTFHHHSPMNSKSSDWATYWKMMGKSGAPEFKLSNMPELEEFWRYNVKTLIDNGIDRVIWGVNFRGNGDRPFWLSYEDAPESMEERAEVIQ
jgi:hypothetical protein